MTSTNAFWIQIPLKAQPSFFNPLKGGLQIRLDQIRGGQSSAPWDEECPLFEMQDEWFLAKKKIKIKKISPSSEDFLNAMAWCDPPVEETWTIQVKPEYLTQVQDVLLNLMWYVANTSCGCNLEGSVLLNRHLTVKPLPNMPQFVNHLHKNKDQWLNVVMDWMGHQEVAHPLIQIIKQKDPARWECFYRLFKENSSYNRSEEAAISSESGTFFALDEPPSYRLKNILWAMPEVLGQGVDDEILKDLYYFGISSLDEQWVEFLLSHPKQAEWHRHHFHEAVSVPVSLLIGELLLRPLQEKKDAEGHVVKSSTPKSLIKNLNHVWSGYRVNDISPFTQCGWRHQDWTRIEVKKGTFVERYHLDVVAMAQRMKSVLQIAQEKGHVLSEQDLQRVYRTVQQLEKAESHRQEFLIFQLLHQGLAACKNLWLDHQFKAVEHEIGSDEGSSLNVKKPRQKRL